MTSNYKRFINYLTEQGDFIGNLQDFEKNSVANIIDFAEKCGFTLTEEDLAGMFQVDIVNKPIDSCACMIGGGGTFNDGTRCGCFQGGGGVGGGKTYCVCVVFGSGVLPDDLPLGNAD